MIRLARAAKAVRLVGGRLVLSGLRSPVAAGLVAAGADLAGLRCYRTVADALQDVSRPVSEVRALRR